MSLYESYRYNLECRIFPGAILDPDIDGLLHIRTDAWKIEYDQLLALKNLGLSLDHIYTEGGGSITLVIDKESTKKVIRK